ncbi:hypothetical protein [Sphingobium naphthae]|uniref:Transposase n=1 Tax=Sphingobium naphthae TaxID=1886786 RepID=A0ABU3ZZI2_9SPHN|nr:hypothetical protein [Sphingobium naphthae]MDV5824934.1 hypothetical protein [Sphingobium naphthae]
MKGTAKVRRRLPGIFLKRSFQTFKERVETQMIVDLLRLTTSRAVGAGQTSGAFRLCNRRLPRQFRRM